MFDPQSFLQQEVTGANDTKYIPHPAGDFPGIVTDLKARQQPNPNDPGVVWTMLDITYTTDDARAKEVMGLDKPTCRQTLFLDLTTDGKIDFSKGKNIALGRVREACGVNNPDIPFSFQQLLGKALVYTVAHKPNKDDPTTPFANVSKVGAL